MLFVVKLRVSEYERENDTAPMEEWIIPEVHIGNFRGEAGAAMNVGAGKDVDAIKVYVRRSLVELQGLTWSIGDRINPHSGMYDIRLAAAVTQGA